MSLSSDGTVMTMPVTPAYGGGYGNGMWGGDWGAWILLFLMFGFGRGGWGGFGNESSCCAPASCADLQRGFDNQSVMNKLNGIEQGISQAGYAALQQTNTLENGLCQLGYQTQVAVNGLGTQLQQCCCDLGRSIDQSTFQTAQGINNIGNKIDACCCETQRQIERGFCDTNYNIATNTTAIIQNAHNDTDRVIAKLDAMEMARKDETISELRSQVNALNLAQSQANQNTYLINTLRPCPTPSYITCNPWAGSGYGGCGTFSGCGCGC